jgi:hypothetical protein
LYAPMTHKTNTPMMTSRTMVAMSTPCIWV